MTRKQEILLHLGLWIYWLGTIGYFYDTYYFSIQDDIWKYLFNYVLSKGLTIIFFYIHYVFIAPMLVLYKKAWKYLFFTLVVSYLNYNLHSVVWNQNDFNFFFNYKTDQVWSLFYNDLGFTVFALGIYLLKKWVNSESLKNNLLEEVKKTELQFLKSQMSPHFLFNTLNNIYGLSLTANNRTSDAIGQLENIMEYVELMEKNIKIPINTEIDFLKDYIALNKLRYKTKMDFIINTEAIDNLQIEPMLLLPLVENAFKHGKNGEDGFLRIHLTLKNTKLYFEVVNNFDGNKRKDDTSGVGLKNVLRRLELIYPYVFDFNQTKELGIFSSSIIIQLK